MTRNLIASLIFLLAQHAVAFKYNTHVWIGQQVIDDLADGKITIEVNGQDRRYDVDDQVRSAILLNPSIYRMGNIGPDAAPDIAAGQLIIHPGTDTFGSDEWAMHLERFVYDLNNRVSDEDWYAFKENQCAQRDYDLDKLWGYISSLVGSGEENPYLEFLNQVGMLDALATGYRDGPMSGPETARKVQLSELAYQKGFLAHFASDTFAHSYVNHYAGDVFGITDDEIDVEKRHVAIEAYIDKHLPSLPQGKAYQLIDSPSEFLAQAFIFNNFAAEKFATVDPKAPLAYFLAVHKLREAVRNTAASCVWTAIERFAGQLVIYRMTDYIPSEHQIAAVNELLDDANQLNLDQLNELNNLIQGLEDSVSREMQNHFDVIFSAHSRAKESIQTLRDLEQRIHDVHDDIANEIVGKTCDYERTVTKKVCKSQPWPINKVCKNVTETITGPACSTHRAYQDAIRLRDELLDFRDQHHANMLADIKTDLENLRDVLEETHQLIDDISDLIMYVASFPLDSLDPFRNALKRWDQTITESMVAWVEAHAQAAKNTLIAAESDASNEDSECFKVLSGIGNCLSKDNPITAPILEWYSIHAPGLLGVPPELTSLLSTGGNLVSDARDLMDGSVRHAFLAQSDPLTRAFIVELERNISRELSGIDLVGETIGLLGEEPERMYQDVLTVFSLRADDNIINDLFDEDNSEKGLLTFDNFVSVMKKDMGVGSNGKIDPNKFAALKNAVTLAKLSLLNSDELNRLANDLGVPNPTSSYGAKLYGNPTMENACYKGDGEWVPENFCVPTETDEVPIYESNIIYRAIKNIDGHQQWKDVADPLPRASGVKFESTSLAQKDFGNSFGYVNIDGRSGFRFWGETSDDTFFAKLFNPHLNQIGVANNAPSLKVNIRSASFSGAWLRVEWQALAGISNYSLTVIGRLNNKQVQFTQSGAGTDISDGYLRMNFYEKTLCGAFGDGAYHLSVQIVPEGNPAAASTISDAGILACVPDYVFDAMP